MTEHGPYILVEDNDGHWYVIPKARESDFNAWAAIPGEDERSWTPPKYADRTCGAPSLVEFASYLIRE
jgi:hypothetical protein